MKISRRIVKKNGVAKIKFFSDLLVTSQINRVTPLCVLTPRLGTTSLMNGFTFTGFILLWTVQVDGCFSYIDKDSNY